MGGHLPERFQGSFNGCLIVFLLLMVAVKFISKFLITSNDVVGTCGRKVGGCGARGKRFHASRGVGSTRVRSIRKGNVQVCGGFCLRRSLAGNDAVHVFTGERRIGLTYLVGKRFPGTTGRVTVSHVCTSGGGVSVKSALGDSARD